MKEYRKMGLRRLRCDRFIALGFCSITSTVFGTLFLTEYLLHHCPLTPRTDPSGIEFINHPSGRYGPYSPKTTPLIFVGGWPRSGTTLMRAILDAHPDVRCGEETHIIPDILARMMGQRNKTTGSQQRLAEAGITEDVLSSAVASFILEVIVRHGEPAERLCNKDPFTLSYAGELNRMFPQAKFLLMVRDGRAVCHSLAFRDVGIGGIDHRNMSICLFNWDRSVRKMYNECLTLGEETCLPVRYEQLVLHPRAVLGKVLEFVGVAWNEVVLHHETEINKPGGISLSRMEPSTDQVIKPVNLDALTKWAKFVPDVVRQQMRQIAPLLETLGYDPDAYPPNYGRPDKEVEENTLLVQKNKLFFEKLEWEVRNRTKLLD